MLKDTKILIPEIPGEWTERVRSGHTNIWNRMWPPEQPNSNGLPEVRLEPPEKGLSAELIDGAWYWVCDCHHCLGIQGKWSYIVCHEHNRCVTCSIHRDDLTDTPWGHPDGFRCKPCQEHMDEKAKREALANAAASGHSEMDCHYQDTIICPHCAAEQSTDDVHADRDSEECDTCGGVYSLELEYSVSYTTRCVTAPRQ